MTDERIVPCETCQSEGRIYRGQYEDERDCGPCLVCEGTGAEVIETEPVDGQSDYEKYRGKCKPMSEAAVAADPSLTLVRGYYYCPIWGEQAHWWTKRPDGSIFDPTKDQFPSRGIGEYVEFDGTIACANCGKTMKEEEADIEGNYAFCSYHCHGSFVGVF